MKRKLFISLGYAPSVQTDRILLSWWVDFAKRNRSRFYTKRNGFNVEKWEAVQTHIAAVPGVRFRVAWKEAWRAARLEARRYDGYEVL